MVQDAAPETRVVGLWTLASLPLEEADPRVLAVVTALSKDADLDVRRSAVEAAQFTAAPGDISVLAALADRLLADEDFSVRRAAAEGLRAVVLDRHKFLGKVCRLLESQLPQVFDVVLRCWALRRRDGRPAAEMALEQVRFSADEFVASIRTAGLALTEEQARDIFALAPELHSHPQKLLKASEVSRAVAVTAAKERLPEFVLEALVRALMDPSTSVRAEAYRTICYVTEPGDTRAMRLLVTHVEKGLGAVKTEVLDALTATAARGDLRVTMALATASEDPRPHLRCVALQCLARHVDLTDAASRDLAKDVAAARSMREETDTAVRKAAGALLASLNASGGGGGGGESKSSWIAKSQIDSIDERLQSTDAQLRYMACREAGLLAAGGADEDGGAGRQRRAGWLERVIHLLRVDEDAAVRAAAIEATGKLCTRALKDSASADEHGGLTTTTTSPSKRPLGMPARMTRGNGGGRAATALGVEAINQMVIGALLQTMRLEPVEATRLQAVNMLREIERERQRVSKAIPGKAALGESLESPRAATNVCERGRARARERG